MKFTFPPHSASAPGSEAQQKGFALKLSRPAPSRRRRLRAVFVMGDSQSREDLRSSLASFRHPSLELIDAHCLNEACATVRDAGCDLLLLAPLTESTFPEKHAAELAALFQDIPAIYFGGQTPLPGARASAQLKPESFTPRELRSAIRKLQGKQEVRSSADLARLAGFTTPDMLEKLPTPILVANARGRVQLANGAARELLRSRAHGIFLRDLGVLERPTASTEDHDASGHSEGGGAAVRLPGSPERWVTRQIREVRQGDQEFFVVCLQDVTAWVTRNRELRSQAKETSRESTERLQLLRRVADEIRTPAWNVLGDLRACREEMPVGQRNRLDTIEKEASEMRRISDAVYDFAESEAPHAPRGEPERFDLQELLQKLVKEFAPVAKEKGVRLLFHADANVPDACTGEPKRLQAMLVVLIRDALDRTRKGVVELRVAARPSDESGKRRLRVIVRDTGRGLSEAECARYFEAVEDRDTPVEGSLRRRLGQQFCREHGGKIAVTGFTGEGSVAWAELDLNTADA